MTQPFTQLSIICTVAHRQFDLRFNLIKVKGDNARTSFVGKLDLQSSCSADLTLPHAPTYLDWLGWGWTLLTT